MTPHEQQLVSELFARLAQLESAPRDPDAERLIAEGVKKAPNAIYALVQTALVQDEALKRANARIEELQAQLGGAAQPQRQQGGFLDNMRDALFGRNEPHGSVPTVRPQTAQSGTAGAPGQPGYAPPRPAPAMAAQPSYPAGQTFGSGGSFLGTAASAAAGAIGGGLLLDGIRSMFGHRAGFAGDDPFAFGGRREDSVLAQSHSGDNNLARQAGIDDINQNYDDQDQQDRYDQQDQNDLDVASQSDDASLSDAFDTADADDDGDFADDDGGMGGDDTYDV
jgi:hypothetical protein